MTDGMTNGQTDGRTHGRMRVISIVSPPPTSGDKKEQGLTYVLDQCQQTFKANAINVRSKKSVTLTLAQQQYLFYIMQSSMT